MIYFSEENLADVVYSTEHGRLSFFYDYSRVTDDYKFTKQSYTKDDVDGYKEYDEESILFCSNDGDDNYWRDMDRNKYTEDYIPYWDGIKRIEKFLSYYAVRFKEDDHNYIMM